MKPDLVRQQTHQAIQRRLGHKFVRIELLQQVLIHRGFNAKNNERFGFVGDAVLNYSIAKMLFDAFPEPTGDKFSRLCANLVDEHVLAEITLKISISDGLYLRAGGLKGGGFRRPSILTDAMEAIFAAVNFDADFATAEEVVRHLFAKHVKRVDFRNQGKDNKTVLQEALQTHHLPPPKYRIEKQVDGMKGSRLVASCGLGELDFICRAQGTNRKVAGQEAAAEVLIQLGR